MCKDSSELKELNLLGDDLLSEKEVGTVLRYLRTTIGQRIKASRNQASMSQEDLAKKLGLSRSSISSFETDKTYPSKKECLTICEVCGVDYVWLTMNDSQIRSTCNDSTKPYKCSGDLK